ncbi:methylenetetrahydrofolate reductase [NAD(P)H] [Sphingomonas sp. Leaf343]|uniref:methylenetetrahydrofolate reductase [NAD(P)H] n=1 Tax=Sphingomonas sp. Leaf343 TaxID=1736345 RepID=UPI0006F30FA6|nr:methylenetetrahydrofolate reductase [NAD(P)H] [Sphingomonas sp. Leaf343]KQR80814.1 5,10-methylenetetrahydrofolate reductase [Sphingomonas sp. Leaf343]
MTISVNQLAEARCALESPLYADVGGDLDVSFEFFPPKNEKMEEQLWESVRTLEPLGPRFVSVTYGAGGTTRERTHATVARIQRETSLAAAAHLTCVEATREEIDQVAEEYWAAGVRHIVALRGDSPTAGTKFASHPGGYENAAALVAGLRKLHPFEISVAAYPENHPDSADAAADLDNLKRKLDAGANRAITQFFFEPETFFRYRDAVAAAGISAEIVPGIMPVSNFASVQRMSAMCGTDVPAWMGRLFEGLDVHPAARQLVAATVAAELSRRLYAGGCKQLHFYTLNRAELAFAICHLLGVRAKAAVQEVAA